MENYELLLTEQAEQNPEETVSLLAEAVNEISKSSEQDFEKIKGKKWYNRLWELVTFSKDNQKIQARGVANLAKLQEIIMKAVVLESKQSAETADNMLEAITKIEELSGDINYLYQSQNEIIKSILSIKRGFEIYRDFNSLSDEKKDTISALVFKFADEIGASNKDTKDLLNNIRNHKTSYDVEYEAVERLGLDEQKLLYIILQTYIFLLKNEFDDHYEIFDYLSISKKNKDDIKENIQKEIKLCGKNGYIDSFKTEYSEDNSIELQYVEFEEPVNGEEPAESALNKYDDTIIREIIFRYAELDENNNSKYLGKLITDKTKYAYVFERVDAPDISIDAVIAVFEESENHIFLVFTTYAIYFTSSNPTMAPYSQIKSGANLCLESFLDGKCLRIEGPNVTIYDKNIDVEHLIKLVAEIVKSGSSLYAETDRNVFFSELKQEIQMQFFASIVYILKKSGQSDFQAFKYYIDNNYSFSWEITLDLASKITNDADFDLLVQKYFSGIPYPSEKSVSGEMVAIALKIIYDTYSSVAINYDMIELLKKLDKNNLNITDLMNALAAQTNYLQSKLFSETSKQSINKTISMLKGAGIGLAASALIPIDMPVALSTGFTGLLGSALGTLIANKKKSTLDADISNIIDAKLAIATKYKELIKKLLTYPDSIKEMYYNKALEGHREALALCIGEKYVDDGMQKAALYDAPEIIFGRKAAEKKPVSEDTLNAEKLYLEYNISKALELLTMAARNGCGRACYYLGEIFANGYGTSVKDTDTADIWRKIGMEYGDCLSALKFAYSLGIESDIKKVAFIAIPQIEKMAREGNASAMLELSDYYDLYNKSSIVSLLTTGGSNESITVVDGKEWLKKAALKGHWKAMNKLACLYWSGKEGMVKDKESAVKYWKKAADLGYEPAVYNIFKQKSLSEYKSKFDEICSRGYAPALNYRAYLKINGIYGYVKLPVSGYNDLQHAAARDNSFAKKNYETYKKKGKVGMFSFQYEFDPLY